MLLLVLLWSPAAEQAVNAVGRAQCPFTVLSYSRDVMCTCLWLPFSLSADIVSRVLCLGSLFAKAWASKSLCC